MITKKEFIDIIDKLKEVNDFVYETNEKARKLDDAIISDFFNASSLSISHENIVVKLLEDMFNDEDVLCWWLYDLDYGRQFKMGYLQDKNGFDIDVRTAGKLYDFLIKNCERKKINIEIKQKVQKNFFHRNFRTQLFECKNRGKSTKNSIKSENS